MPPGDIDFSMEFRAEDAPQLQRSLAPVTHETVEWVTLFVGGGCTRRCRGGKKFWRLPVDLEGTTDGGCDGDNPEACRAVLDVLHGHTWVCLQKREWGK